MSGRARALTEVDEHLAVTLPHVLRHGEDAGHVVVQEGVLLLRREKSCVQRRRCLRQTPHKVSPPTLYLREVANQVTARVVGFGHDVKEEGFDVVVQSLVVQEEFGQQAQILTVDLKEVASSDVQKHLD